MDYSINNQWNREVVLTQALSYAQSLRAIGQALEALHLNSFELHKNGSAYVLRVGVASARKLEVFAGKVSGRLRQGDLGLEISMTSSDVERLDADGRSRRGSGSGRPTANLSLSLRVVGDFLDEKRAVTFSISWSPQLVMVQYETPNGDHRMQDFTTENLFDREVHKRGVRMYLRRSWRKPTRR